MDETTTAILDADLPPALQVTLLEIYRAADGHMFVGTHGDIAEARGVQRGTVSKQIRTLVSEGYLEKKGGCLIIHGDSVSATGDTVSIDGDSVSTNGDTVSDDGDSVSEPEESEVPPRQKKVSTPSKKNPTPQAEPSSSLRSEDCSGDGAPSADDPKLSAGGLPDDDTDHPAIGIYRSNAQRYPNRQDRRRIIDAVGEQGTEKYSNRMSDWRKTMNDWAKNSWSWGNIDGMLDRFQTKVQQQNGQANSGHNATEGTGHDHSGNGRGGQPAGRGGQWGDYA